MRNAHVRDIRVIDMLVIKVRFAVQNINLHDMYSRYCITEGLHVTIT